MPTILDFHIEPESDGHYRLGVFERGNTQPLARTTFSYDLSFLTEHAIRQLDVDPKDPVGRMVRLKQFGAELYEKLFVPEVRQVWQAHKDGGDFLVLCLRIAPEARGLEAVPWETLHDGETFLAAGANTGLSRLPLDLTPQEDLPALAPPLKMLAVIASPLDLEEHERLQIEREQELLLQAVNDPSGAGRLLLETEDEARLPILEGSLEEGYQILHFTGHGIPPEGGGGLLLEDAHGKRRPTSVAEVLGALRDRFRTYFRVIVGKGKRGRNISRCLNLVKT